MGTVIKDYSIPAGAKLPIFIPGKFFFLMGADSACNVNFIRKNTRYGYADGVGYGFAANFDSKPFEGIEIESADASAQTVKIGISDDPIFYQRMVGEVQITGTLPAFAADPQIAGITNPLTPHEIATTHYERLSGSTDALETIVTPAANTNGVVIYAARIKTAIGYHMRLMVKQSAPTAWDDTDAISNMHNSSSSTIGRLESLKCAFPVKIPAGYGVYIQSSYAGSVSGCFVNYKVL